MKDLLKKKLEKTIPSQELNKWFPPLHIFFNDSTDTLSVTFPHAFFQPWFKKLWQQPFEQAVHELMHELYLREINIAYILPQEKHTKPIFLQHEHSTKQAFFTTNHGVEHQFFYNSKNSFPIAAAHDVLRMHTPLKYNPFIIYGKSGTGKTHIIENMQRCFASVHAVFFERGETFWKLFHKENLEYFLAKYTIFIIDDIHRTMSDSTLNISLQEKFLTFMDVCYKENKQIILTCLHAPNSEKNFHETIRSRMYNGLVVKLKSSDMDVRMRCALHYMKELDMKLSRDHLLLLAQRCKQIPFLRGVLKKICAFTSFSNQELTTTDVENVLLSSGGEDRRIEAKTIIAQTALHFSLQEEDLLGAKRIQDVVKARQIAIYLCRELLGLSSPALGLMFGGRDHTTIIYSINKIKKLNEIDVNMQNTLAQIKKKVYV